MKICNLCKETKPYTEFHRNGKSWRSYCKPCLIATQRLSTIATSEYINSLKPECSVCKYDRCKKALEFHHLDESTKLFTIGSFGAKATWSPAIKKRIDEEVAKCIVLCSNCHREYHDGMIQLPKKETI